MPELLEGRYVSLCCPLRRFQLVASGVHFVGESPDVVSTLEPQPPVEMPFPTARAITTSFPSGRSTIYRPTTSAITATRVASRTVATTFVASRSLTAAAASEGSWRTIASLRRRSHAAYSRQPDAKIARSARTNFFSRLPIGSGEAEGSPVRASLLAGTVATGEFHCGPARVRKRGHSCDVSSCSFDKS